MGKINIVEFSDIRTSIQRARPPRLPLRQAYEAQHTAGDPLWMDQTQEQLWDLIQANENYPKFLLAAAEIRRRLGISPQEEHRLYSAALREGRHEQNNRRPSIHLRPGRGIIMPPDLPPNFSSRRSQPTTAAARWLSYRDRITAHDLRKLRKILNLAPAFDEGLRKYLLTGEMTTLPFRTVRLRVLQRGRRHDRMFLDVFRDSSIAHVIEEWPMIAQVRKDLYLQPIRTNARLHGELLVSIEIGSKSTRDEIKLLWCQKVKRLLPRLRGTPRNRYRSRLEDTKEIERGYAKGLSGKDRLMARRCG